MSNINIVQPDSSSAFIKYELLKSKGYLSRSRWERAGTIDVLPTNFDYINLLTQDKTPFAIEHGTSRFRQQIDATFFTDNKGYYLYSTVLSYKKPNDATKEMAVINSTKKTEIFAAASAFINKDTFTETGRGNLQIETLPSIQLFRYDPVGKGYHVNVQGIRSVYSNFTKEQAEVYENYFNHTVDFPHFHFPNKSMSLAYGKTTESDAISLENLANYVKDLIEMPEDKKDVLSDNTFGMPYLGILCDPHKYTTSVDFKNLIDIAKHITYNSQLFNVFKNTQAVENQEIHLTGLTAVYADLTLLQILRTLSEDDNATPVELRLACKIASGGLLYPNLEITDPNFDPNKIDKIVDKNTPKPQSRKSTKRPLTSSETSDEISEDNSFPVGDCTNKYSIIEEENIDNPIYGYGNPYNETPFKEKLEKTSEMIANLVTLSNPSEQSKILTLKPNNNPPQGGPSFE